MDNTIKAYDVITEANDLSPNQYSNDLKLKWLRDLDGKIFQELIEKHEDEETVERFEEADYDDTDVELLIPPHSMQNMASGPHGITVPSP